MVIKPFDTAVAGPAVLAAFFDLHVAHWAEGDVVLAILGTGTGCIGVVFEVQHQRERQKWVQVIRGKAGIVGLPRIHILSPYQPFKHLPFQPPKHSQHYLTQYPPVIQLYLAFPLFILPKPCFVRWVDRGAPYK